MYAIYIYPYMSLMHECYIHRYVLAGSVFAVTWWLHCPHPSVATTRTWKEYSVAGRRSLMRTDDALPSRWMVIDEELISSALSTATADHWIS